MFVPGLELHWYEEAWGKRCQGELAKFFNAKLSQMHGEHQVPREDIQESLERGL
jgi:hypothetical protein